MGLGGVSGGSGVALVWGMAATVLSISCGCGPSLWKWEWFAEPRVYARSNL